ncbi:four helix bundle protein, partial [bacterium]|nr:four helix bundle protein [bacterium]
MFNFEKLVIWQKMRSLVKNVYNLSGTFPRHEKFCLTQHIR